MSKSQSPFFNKKSEETRHYLVLGCTKSCNHPMVHPDTKWASVDEADWSSETRKKAPDYLFSIGRHDPRNLPKPPSGYKVMFFESLPMDVLQEKMIEPLVNSLLCDDGVIIIDNMKAGVALDLARKCGFKGDILVSGNGTLVIAKNAKTDFSDMVENKDFYRAINREDIPFRKHSKEISISSKRAEYKTLIHLYDICLEYKASRQARRMRNYFKDNAYEKCLGKIAADIKTILTDEKTDPTKRMSELRQFVSKHLEEKTFPNTMFRRVDRKTRNDDDQKVKKDTPYGYTMNEVLEDVQAYCDYISPLSRDLQLTLR